MLTQITLLSQTYQCLTLHLQVYFYFLIYVLAPTVKAWAKMNSLNRKMKGFELKSDRFTIGRAQTNDLTIKDARLSMKHCSIIKTQGSDGCLQVCIEDSSTNGTFVNG